MTLRRTPGEAPIDKNSARVLEFFKIVSFEINKCFAVKKLGCAEQILNASVRSRI